MMCGKNKVRVIKFRLKMDNPNILVVKCCFTQNKLGDNKLFFILGEKCLKAKISVKEGIEVRKKHLLDSYIIDKEYFFWIPIPKDLNKKSCIRVFEEVQGKSSLVYVIPSSKIIKLRKKIDMHIDDPQIISNKIILNGWYVSRKSVNFEIRGKNHEGIKYELKEIYRQDVLEEYPEAKGENIHGFRIGIENISTSGIEITLNDGERVSDYFCEFFPSNIKKIVLSSKKLSSKTVSYLKSNGTRKTLKRILVKIFKIDENNYKLWIKKNCPSLKELEEQSRTRFTYSPKISIIVPLYKTPLVYLEELVKSVKAQTYANWELCLSDGSGEKNIQMTKILNQYKCSDKRIKVVICDRALQISENTNKAIQIAQGDYFAFVDHDDLLSPDALFECVAALNKNREINILYSDEDKVSMNGKEFFEPHFKTDFNINLLCSMNYICHLFVVSKQIVHEIGMMRAEYDGAQDYDFILRSVEVAKSIYHIPKVLYHWRSHKGSTAENPKIKQYAFAAGAKAVQAHYDRLGIKARVLQGEELGLYRTEHILDEHPLISIIIPNKDHIEDLEHCISTLEKKSRYDNYEFIIVENNSEKEETFQYYKKLEKDNKKISIVYWEREFNYSAINNYGAKYAKGEYLLLLNNDTEIINEQCLEELLGYCMHDDIGVVGARLYYNDNTIQHAGVIVGFGGVAGHAFIGLPHNEKGYFSRIICAQDLCAVTGACMMVKKRVFDEVGGFDENLVVAYNDIDLCLKIREAGYLVVYNPYAELYHYESKSRGLEDTKEKLERFHKEMDIFRSKWSEIIKNGDPFYNPNLSLERCDFGLK